MSESYKSLRLPASADILGFDEINAQHKTIADLIDGLRRDIGARQRMAFADFKTAAQRIGEAMRHHFAYEETVMERLGYPTLTEHRAQHQAYMTRLEDLLAGVASTGYATANTVDDIFAMLVDDALKADLEFKSFLYTKDLIH